MSLKTLKPRLTRVLHRGTITENPSWQRSTNTHKLYNRQWSKVRTVYLKSNPLCVICMKDGHIKAANVVDHIKPHKGNLELFWDVHNFQALCKPCHDRKTAKEDGGFGNAPNSFSEV